MTTPETPVDIVNPLFGLRCADETHRGHGRVYSTSLGRHQIESLAESNRCYELVQSHDGGQTWEQVTA